MLARQLVLLAVVHATRSKWLSGPDVTASGSPSALATTDEGEEGKDDVPKTHHTDGDDEADDKALVLAVTRVKVAIHAVAVADSVGGIGAGGISAGIAAGRGQGGIGGSVGGVGRGTRRDIRLELPGGLFATGDSTAGGTFLDGEGDVIGDLSSNLFNLRLVDAKGSRDNIRRQTKVSLSDLVYTWERIPKESYKGHRVASVIVLKVDGALGEESGLVCKDFVEDELGAVFRDHAGDEGAVGNEIEFWGPRVCVRGIESAWAKETGSDGDIVPDGGGHGLRIGGGGETGTTSGPGGDVIHEIEFESSIREEGDPGDIRGDFQELSDELSLGGDAGESDCGKDEES